MIRSVVFLFMLLFNAKSSQSSGNLKVIVKGMKSNQGNVIIRLYNSPDGFPLNGEKAIKTASVKASGNAAEFTFKNLDFGTYAIAAYHDENDNKMIDKNFIGIPKEGIGVSNNAKGHFGPPKYEDAKFIFSGNSQLTFTLNYL